MSASSVHLPGDEECAVQMPQALELMRVEWCNSRRLILPVSHNIRFASANTIWGQMTCVVVYKNLGDIIQRQVKQEDAQYYTRIVFAALPWETEANPASHCNGRDWYQAWKLLKMKCTDSRTMIRANPMSEVAKLNHACEPLSFVQMRDFAHEIYRLAIPKLIQND